MRIQIKCFDQHGNYITTLSGEALPRYPRLPAPPDCKVSLLSRDDFDRLKRAFLRFTRAIEARQHVGDVSMNFDGIKVTAEATKKPRDADIKVLALEMRPFFLEKDPLSFTKLSALRSLGGTECLRPCLKQHRARWENSAFEGRMSLAVNGRQFDTTAVVRAWFNGDFFHTESERADELSLDELTTTMGGREQAITLLTHHMIDSLRVIAEFFEDIYNASSQFAEWAATLDAKP